MRYTKGILSMIRLDRALLLCGVAVIIALGIFACNGRKSPPAGDGTVTPLDVGAPPPGCTYNTEAKCYRCGPGDLLLMIGCRAQGDCKVFCSLVLPEGYSRCVDLPTPDSPCYGWSEPKPPLSACIEDPHHPDPPGYLCRACSISVTTVFTPARGPDGGCVIFATGCIAEGFVADATCAR